jgi:type II secretory pathway pseudopilin PulG
MRRGFTLVEVLICCGLVVVLCMGITTVFSITSRTIGAGTTLGNIHRDNRAAQSIIYGDLRGAVIGPQAPCLINTTWTTTATAIRSPST